MFRANGDSALGLALLIGLAGSAADRTFWSTLIWILSLFVGIPLLCKFVIYKMAISGFGKFALTVGLIVVVTGLLIMLQS